MALGNPYELDQPASGSPAVPGLPAAQGSPQQAQPAASGDDLMNKFGKMQQIFGGQGGQQSQGATAGGGPIGGFASGIKSGMGNTLNIMQMKKLLNPSTASSLMGGNGGFVDAPSMVGEFGGADALAGSAGIGDILGAGGAAGGIEGLGALLGGGGAAAGAAEGGLALADLLPLLALA